VVPSTTALISECADSAAVTAEEMFRASIQVLDDLRKERGVEVAEEPIPLWPLLEDGGGNGEIEDW